MWFFVQILFAGILTSFFFFPVEFTVLPGINTKMMLAAAGLFFAGGSVLKTRFFGIPRELMWLIIFSSSVSLVSLLSITLNQTPDVTYVSYIVSFSVWLSAAFAVCSCIRAVHGRIDVQLILNYLIVVSLFQCIIALVIDQNPSVQRFVDSYIIQGQDLMHEINRLYGIGAMLDVAGLRFSAVLVTIAFFLSELKTSLKTGTRFLYILSFCIITVIGNMIARTTLTGAAIGMAFIIIGMFFSKPDSSGTYRLLFFNRTAVFSWLLVIVIGVFLSVYLYNTDMYARRQFRFAFEGFFSLVEKGHWETTSTDKLQTMVVFPETIHTWVIGDGYFMNSRYDENYLGDATDQGFYMGTDVGYLRFIFYFGILGLIPMMGVIVYSAIVCMRHFKEERWVFILVLLVGLVVWLKVSTDVFLFFALFLSAAAIKEGDLESARKTKERKIRSLGSTTIPS